jgi:hypothetical protein
MVTLPLITIDALMNAPVTPMYNEVLFPSESPSGMPIAPEVPEDPGQGIRADLPWGEAVAEYEKAVGRSRKL